MIVMCYNIQVITGYNIQVITGYREAEKSQWRSAVSLSVVQRLKEAAVEGRSLPTLPLLHVLDLNKDG